MLRNFTISHITITFLLVSPKAVEFGAGFRSEGGQVYIKCGNESVTCFSKAGISGDKMQTLMWSWALWSQHLAAMSLSAGRTQ